MVGFRRQKAEGIAESGYHIQKTGQGQGDETSEDDEEVVASLSAFPISMLKHNLRETGQLPDRLPRFDSIPYTQQDTCEKSRELKKGVPDIILNIQPQVCIRIGVPQARGFQYRIASQSFRINSSYLEVNG